MARIAGVDLPRTKRVEIGLTYIYGIGRVRSNIILKDAGVGPECGEEAKVFSRPSDYGVRRSGKQAFTVSVHQHDALLSVERKNGDVDLGHDRAQQRRSFLRFPPG